MSKIIFVGLAVIAIMLPSVGGIRVKAKARGGVSAGSTYECPGDVGAASTIVECNTTLAKDDKMVVNCGSSDTFIPPHLLKPLNDPTNPMQICVETSNVAVDDNCGAPTDGTQIPVEGDIELTPATPNLTITNKDYKREEDLYLSGQCDNGTGGMRFNIKFEKSTTSSTTSSSSTDDPSSSESKGGIGLAILSGVAALAAAAF